jgi:hypothetical protein
MSGMSCVVFAFLEDLIEHRFRLPLEKGHCEPFYTLGVQAVSGQSCSVDGDDFAPAAPDSHDHRRI